MPFILICGYPCCGKTTKANEIKKNFEEVHHQKVVLINEETLGLKKNEAYLGNLTKKRKVHYFFRLFKRKSNSWNSENTCRKEPYFLNHCYFRFFELYKG
jgi:tRNA uridine 5-carbamoylmethylation protein Kti12